jgi:lipopolysaccharide export system protein LptA
MMKVKLIALLVLIMPLPLWALGNDSLIQGSLEIHSDRLVIHFNEAGDLQLKEMTGSPASFRQLDDDQLKMLGQAKQINYFESSSQLELKDEARFSHNGDTIESDRIRIDTNDNSIQAGSSDSDQRVKMLIKPRAQ